MAIGKVTDAIKRDLAGKLDASRKLQRGTERLIRSAVDAGMTPKQIAEIIAGVGFDLFDKPNQEHAWKRGFYDTFYNRATEGCIDE